MSYLARAALRTGMPELHVDLLSGVAGPPELLSRPVATSIENRVAQFLRQLRAEGADPAKVREASLAIRFELTEHRCRTELADLGGAISIPFSATVRILDDRGVEHVGEHRGAWATERREPEQREAAAHRRRWWRFWRRSA